MSVVRAISVCGRTDRDREGSSNVSTALATTPSNGIAHRTAVPPEIMEQVLARGDLSRLTDVERTQWYNARCEAAGLDPRCQPFDYITLQGKLVLYAKKSATDQLSGIHQIKLEILSKNLDTQTGIYSVDCRATFPSGRFVEDTGVVFVQGLKGNDLANALMKGITKAKRRAILSAVGLGMLDETEVEDLSYGETNKPEPPQNNSGHGRGQYASPEQIKTYKEAIEKFCEGRNTKWLDKWQQVGGELPKGLKELLSVWQLDGHLLKWAVETKRLDQTIVPENAKSRQLAAYVAIVWHRSDEDKRAVKAEISAYATICEQRQTDVIMRANPELFPEAESDEILDAEFEDNQNPDADDPA